MAAKKRRKPAGWVESAPCVPESTYPAYSRKEMRACLIAQETKVKKAKGQPFAVLTMGVPGTGKTTLVEPFLKGKSYACSCPDLIKEQLPEFTLALSKRAKNAGSVVHKESVKIASDIADRAVRERKNLLIDGTGAHLGRYEKVIRRLKAAGYKVTVLAVHAPFSEVKKRIAGRAKATGRFMPASASAWYRTRVPCNFLPIAGMTDDFRLYDVTGKKPKPILIKRGSKTSVVDPGKLARITGSCKLPPKGVK
jgi:molybdopterin-guanine dinucleotide biosynthesis protein